MRCEQATRPARSFVPVQRSTPRRANRDQAPGSEDDPSATDDPCVSRRRRFALGPSPSGPCPAHRSTAAYRLNEGRSGPARVRAAGGPARLACTARQRQSSSSSSQRLAGYIHIGAARWRAAPRHAARARATGQQSPGPRREPKPRAPEDRGDSAFPLPSRGQWRPRMWVRRPRRPSATAGGGGAYLCWVTRSTALP